MARSEFEQAVGSRGDHDLFFGADDQVAIGERREPRRHRFGLHVARETRLVARQPPQIRPIIDVEDHLGVVSLGQRDRLGLRRRRVGFGEMRPGHDDGARPRDQRLVDVAFVQRHVGAVGAIEDRRRNALGLDREQHQTRQAVLVDMHPVGDDPFARELLANEPPICSAPTPGDQRRLQSESRGADGDVSRAAADGLGEAGDVLEPAADLLAVEVDGTAADRDQIERFVSVGALGHLSPCEWDRRSKSIAVGPARRRRSLGRRAPVPACCAVDFGLRRMSWPGSAAPTAKLAGACRSVQIQTKFTFHLSLKSTGVF